MDTDAMPQQVNCNPGMSIFHRCTLEVCVHVRTELLCVDPFLPVSAQVQKVHCSQRHANASPVRHSPRAVISLTRTRCAGEYSMFCTVIARMQQRPPC